MSDHKDCNDKSCDDSHCSTHGSHSAHGHSGGGPHGKHGKHGKPHFYGATTVGEKGQIVIPAEARKENDIKPGDKLIVAGKGKHGLMLIKAEILTDKIEHLSKKLDLLKSMQEEDGQ